MNAILELYGVSRSFGGVHAVSDVSFEVHAGECLALLGGNGAGKSTIVAMVSGLLRPDSGEIRVDGRAVELNDPGVSRAAGIETVFQNLGLCENLDAPGNFYLGRELYRRPLGFKFLRRGDMRDETRRALQEIGVRMPSLDAPVIKLSGGQRQALAFARAVRGKSRILLLDEPTAALGLAEKEQIVTAVRGLVRDQNMAVVLISHDMAEVRQLADRVVVLRRGRLAAQQMPDVGDMNRIVSLITGAEE